MNYTVIEPSREQLEKYIQPLRHEVLDPERQIWIDEELSSEDFLGSAVHRAAFSEGIAIAAVRIDAIASNSLNAMVRKMATRKEFARQGIGSDVLRAAEEQAARQGVRNFWLDARERAIPFFEKNGYTLTNNTIIHEDGVLNYRMNKRAT